MILLPGNDLIVDGIEDLRHQRQTVEALLVAIGAPKLRSLGVDVPEIYLRILNIDFTISCQSRIPIQPSPNITR